MLHFKLSWAPTFRAKVLYQVSIRQRYHAIVNFKVLFNEHARPDVCRKSGESWKSYETEEEYQLGASHK